VDGFFTRQAWAAQCPNDYKTKHKKGLKAVWITPLRALSQEIKQSAERIVEDLELPLTVGIRTGDTSNKERARQRTTLPEMQHSVLVKANLKKKIKVRSIIPKQMETFPWRGHLGLHLLDDVISIIKKSKTTLLFTNTRSQCEIWFQKILEKYPEFAGEMAMHHGSVNKETRIWVENAIRNESLKAVVCTSSLDLGVDFAPVETVIQIGGPKGVARFLQRAGRSGHQPGKTSVIHFF